MSQNSISDSASLNTSDPKQPKPEYPRPILSRPDWLNLNGEWQFEQDPADIGLAQRWYLAHQFAEKIIVPFSPESEASGINNNSIAEVIWYQREFVVPDGWHQPTAMENSTDNSTVLINFGASDYFTRVFINGAEVGQHQGGYSPFSLDIGHALTSGINKVTVRVEDSPSWMQPRGKQIGTTKWPIDYDPITGIWQTVWLEPVNKHHITELHSAFSLADNTLTLTVGTSSHFSGELRVTVQDPTLDSSTHNSIVTTAIKDCAGRSETRIQLVINEPKTWRPASPYLYDLTIELLVDDAVIDSVDSYAGLREITLEENVFKLNREALYLRGVLDQGYFQKGWYTPLDDEAIRKDIELTLAMGFNFVRKHQKAEDPRYLYWADKLGLMVWAEMPSGKIFSTELITSLTQEWMSLVRRDRAHPSVITWVPFNESWGVWHQAERPEQRALVDSLVSLTHALDQSRPVIGNDGWEYSSGDLWTLHIYEDNEKTIADKLDRVLKAPSSSVADVGSPRVGALPGSDVTGLPILLTECGGIGYLPANYTGDQFSYGSLPESIEDLELRFRAIANEINDADVLCGFVWTQLTDIQQEINGVLYFDRSPKLPLDTLFDIFANIGNKSHQGLDHE